MTRDQITTFSAAAFLAVALAAVSAFAFLGRVEALEGAVADCLMAASEANPGAPITVACPSF